MCLTSRRAHHPHQVRFFENWSKPRERKSDRIGSLKGRLSDEKKAPTEGQIAFALRKAETGTPAGGGDPEDGRLYPDVLSVEEAV